MDFKKLGQQVGQFRKQAEDKLGDRAEPDNLKRDAKDLREILAGDGSLAEKAKQAKEEVINRGGEVPKDESPEDPGPAGPSSGATPGDS